MHQEKAVSAGWIFMLPLIKAAAHKPGLVVCLANPTHRVRQLTCTLAVAAGQIIVNRRATCHALEECLLFIHLPFCGLGNGTFFQLFPIPFGPIHNDFLAALFLHNRGTMRRTQIQTYILIFIGLEKHLALATNRVIILGMFEQADHSIASGIWMLYSVTSSASVFSSISENSARPILELLAGTGTSKRTPPNLKGTDPAT